MDRESQSHPLPGPSRHSPGFLGALVTHSLSLLSAPFELPCPERCWLGALFSSLGQEAASPWKGPDITLGVPGTPWHVWRGVPWARERTDLMVIPHLTRGALAPRLSHGPGHTLARVHTFAHVWHRQGTIPGGCSPRAAGSAGLVRPSLARAQQLCAWTHAGDSRAPGSAIPGAAPLPLGLCNLPSHLTCLYPGPELSPSWQQGHRLTREASRVQRVPRQQVIVQLSVQANEVWTRHALP